MPKQAYDSKKVQQEAYDWCEKQSGKNGYYDTAEDMYSLVEHTGDTINSPKSSFLSRLFFVDSRVDYEQDEKKAAENEELRKQMFIDRYKGKKKYIEERHQKKMYEKEYSLHESSEETSETKTDVPRWFVYSLLVLFVLFVYSVSM